MSGLESAHTPISRREEKTEFPAKNLNPELANPPLRIGRWSFSLRWIIWVTSCPLMYKTLFLGTLLLKKFTVHRHDF